ncbi:hypothetical protein PAXINDRAFT_103593 [Paxillus involutus ATCC 200175]|uniref:Uncharacterized protein n=1 Tax=Paxillus involutus ATCC 200175 TaxID=664439 RepID=A0A0C9SU42_PAXIN|nr:hypothetical protein PAXINDRAFT_103593 [Paxillus involutus ATCC 200175]
MAHHTACSAGLTTSPTSVQQVATQTTPVRETIEPVEVAAGRDRPFWIVLERITWTPAKKMIFMLFFCRQPGPRERGGFAPINRNTRPNSSRTRAGNAAAANNQSGRPETGRGAKNAGAGPVSSPPIASNPVIDSQPGRTATMHLSGEGPGSEPLTPCEPSSSTPMVIPPLLSVSSNSAGPSARPSSHGADVPSAITLSPMEIAMIEEYRRRQATSGFVETTAKS